MSGRSLVAVATVCLLASSAAATTVRYLDTRALTKGSHEVVIGTVERVESRWNERRTQIVTDVTLRVTRSLKGSPSERITLTQLGGEVDGVRVTVHAAPVFTPGQEALVFVWRDARGRAQVNGLAQGKFDITVEPGGRKVVQRTVPGFAVRDVRTLTRAADRARAPGIALDELIAEIGRVVEEEGR